MATCPVAQMMCTSCTCMCVCVTRRHTRLESLERPHMLVLLVPASTDMACDFTTFIVSLQLRIQKRYILCVCVCVRERERERVAIILTWILGNFYLCDMEYIPPTYKYCIRYISDQDGFHMQYIHRI